MKKGTKVEHKEFGIGIIVKDTECLCKTDEVMVKFHDGLPSMKINSGMSSNWSFHEDTDIFKKTELEIIK